MTSKIPSVILLLLLSHQPDLEDLLVCFYVERTDVPVLPEKVWNFCPKHLEGTTLEKVKGNRELSMTRLD